MNETRLRTTQAYDMIIPRYLDQVDTPCRERGEKRETRNQKREQKGATVRECRSENSSQGDDLMEAT